MRPRLAVGSILALTASALAAQSPAPPQPPQDSAAAVIAPPPAPVGRGRITGHVLCDDTHHPARGALILVAPVPAPPGAHGNASGSATMMGHVGTDGTYTFEHVPPGEYTVFAFSPGYLSATDDLLAAQIEGAEAGPERDLLVRNGTVTLRGSDSANFDITLHRGAAITGRVLYSDGAPASQVTLVVENTATKPAKDQRAAQEQEMARAVAQQLFTHQSFTTDDRGNFRLLGLQPGTYRVAAVQATPGSLATGGDAEGMGMLFSGVADPRALRFYAGDTPHRAGAKTFDLRAGDEVNGVEITLPIDALHDLRGTVTAKDGRTLNTGDLTLTDNTDPTLVFHEHLQPDGTFAIHQVPAGNYTLAVSAARIAEPGKPPPGMPAQFGPLEPKYAFADGSLTLLVKDIDLTDVSVTLDQIPLPKDSPAATPTPPTSD